jgi:hypothetical protein
VSAAPDATAPGPRAASPHGAASLLGAIERCLDEPGLALPVCDPGALTGRADDDPATLVALAEGEPVLAASLLREANGPVYDALAPADSLALAVRRIGSPEARRLIRDLDAGGPFGGASGVLARALRESRTRSLARARTGARVAGTAGHPELGPKVALLGLLSDMGVPFLARALGEHAAERRDAPALNDFAIGEALAELAEPCGLRLLERWRLAPRSLAVLQGRAAHAEDRRLATLLGMARTIVSSIAPAPDSPAGGSGAAPEWGQALWDHAELLALSDVDVAALQVYAEDDVAAVSGEASPKA